MVTAPSVGGRTALQVFTRSVGRTARSKKTCSRSPSALRPSASVSAAFPPSSSDMRQFCQIERRIDLKRSETLFGVAAAGLSNGVSGEAMVENAETWSPSPKGWYLIRSNKVVAPIFYSIASCVRGTSCTATM